MLQLLIPFFLILLSSVFNFLSHPDFIFTDGLSIFALITFVPILIVLPSISLKKSPLWGFLYGFISYLFLCNWLITYNIWAGLSVYFLFGLYWAVIFLLLKLCENITGKFQWVISFFAKTFIIFIFEYLSTAGYLGFSYGVSGYAFWKNEILVSSAKYFGVWGITLASILGNVFIAEFLHNVTKNGMKGLLKAKNQLLAGGTVFTFVVFILIVTGSICLNKNERNDEVLKVLLIQNNCDPWKDGIEEYKAELDSLLKLTDRGLEENPQTELVVWPETAVVVDVINHYKARKDKDRYEMAVRLFDYINSKKCVFVIGNNYKNFNSAVLFKGNTVSGDYKLPENEIYCKNHLVPFSEDFPCKKILAPVYKKMLEAGNVFWDRGTGAHPLTMNLKDRRVKIGTPICFEDTFSNISHKMKKNGARMIVNLSNDSWSDSKACQFQHLSMAVFRCAENSIPAVRATNSGQTCYINSSGHVEQMLEPFTENWLYCEVKLNKLK